MSLKPLKVFRSPLSSPSDHPLHATLRSDSKNLKSPTESTGGNKSFLFNALREGLDSNENSICSPKVPYLSYKKSNSQVYHDDFSVNLGKRQNEPNQDANSDQSSRQDSMMTSISSIDPVNWLQSIMLRKVSKQRPSIRRVLVQPSPRKPDSPKLREIVRRKSCHCSWCGGISGFEKKTLHLKPTPMNLQTVQLKVDEAEPKRRSIKKESSKKFSNHFIKGEGLLRKNSKTPKKKDNSFSGISQLLINKKVVTSPQGGNNTPSSGEEKSTARAEVEPINYNEVPKRRGSRFLMEFLEKQNLAGSQGVKSNQGSPRRNSFNYAPTINLLNESGTFRATWVAERVDDSPKNKLGKNLLQCPPVNDMIPQPMLFAEPVKKSDSVISSLLDHDIGQSLSKTSKNSALSTRKLDESLEQPVTNVVEKPRTRVARLSINEPLKISAKLSLQNMIPMSPKTMDTGNPKIFTPNVKKGTIKTARKVKPLTISQGNTPRASPTSMDNRIPFDGLKMILPDNLRIRKESPTKKKNGKKNKLLGQSQSQLSIVEPKESSKFHMKSPYLMKLESQLSEKIQNVRKELSRNLSGLKIGTPRDKELVGIEWESGLLSAKNRTTRSKMRDEGIYISPPETPKGKKKDFIISSRKEKSILGAYNSQSIERIINQNLMPKEKKMIRRTGSVVRDVSTAEITGRYQPQKKKAK